MMMLMNALSENDVFTLSATSTAPHIVAGLRSRPVEDHDDKDDGEKYVGDVDDDEDDGDVYDFDDK